MVVTSSGDPHGVDADRHFVVSAEPVVTTAAAGASVDRIHARGEWEVPLLAPLGSVDVVGWQTRHDRLAAATAPRDGQADRVRSDAVLVHAGGSQPARGVAEFRSLLAGQSLLFTADFAADAGVTLEEPAVRHRSPFLRAVVSVGEGLPADALAFGTPVIVVDDDAPEGIEGVRCVRFDDLPNALAKARPGRPSAADPADNPLRRHVETACELLD